MTPGARLEVPRNAEMRGSGRELMGTLGCRIIQLTVFTVFTGRA